jgi:hypothetical protein
MRKAAYTSVAAIALVLMTAGPALAHICFVADKPDGAGSAGSATLTVDVATDGTELSFTFVPGPDLQGNPHSERLLGAFVTAAVTVNIWEAEEFPDGEPLLTLSRTEDLLFQNTVGGHAHFAGPGASGCDDVGMESLGACFEEALFG